MTTSPINTLNDVEDACNKMQEDQEQQHLEQSTFTLSVNPVENRKEFRVLKSFCLKCSRLVPWAKKKLDCNNDVECPARNVTLIEGRDPQIMADYLADLVYQNDVLKPEEYPTKEEWESIINSTNFLVIISLMVERVRQLNS